MIVFARKNILFQQNGASYLLKKDSIGTVPAWVSDSAYFAALVKDGKIVISESKKDADLEKAEKKAKKTEKAKQVAHIKGNE